MIDGKFNVVFRGQIVKSFDLQTVKENLAKLFKSTPDAMERLFTGAEVVIRKDLDYAGAMKYQSALRNAGALALIKEVEAAPSEPQPSANRGRANFISEPEKSDNIEETSTDNLDNSSEVKGVAKVVEAEPPISANNPVAKETVAKTADSGGELTIAEAGAQIMPDKVYEKRDVDTSSLSLAQAGERILPPSAPEKAPDVSIDHLKLDD